MRAVLDTNVLVSIVISRGAPYRIHEAWLRGEFELVISPAVATELQDVLARPHISRIVKWSRSRLDSFFAALQDRALWVDLVQEISRLTTDPDDNRVLEAAVESVANYIVTGDRHLLDLKEHAGVEIVTPAQFLVILAEEAMNE